MTIRRNEVAALLEGVKKDLRAFDEAHAAIQRRRLERETEGTLEDFADWAGTKAIENVLVMVRVRCLGLIEDLEKNLAQMPKVELVRMEDAE